MRGKDMIVKTVTIFGFITLLYFVGFKALMMPDVLVSYSTNECVEVINYDKAQYSCENMPRKYNHIWAK
jgi:hypothetical protein